MLPHSVIARRASGHAPPGLALSCCSFPRPARAQIADCLRLPPAIHQRAPACPAPSRLCLPDAVVDRAGRAVLLVCGVSTLSGCSLRTHLGTLALAELRSSRELLAAFAQPPNGAVAGARRCHDQLYLARSAPLLLVVLPFALADAVVCPRPSGFAEGLQTEQPHENAHDPV
jgi:hypothetical protein